MSPFVSGGGAGGTFHSKRYALASGLNSPNLDFLPVQNIEELDTMGGVGAVPVGKCYILFRTAFSAMLMQTAF